MHKQINKFTAVTKGTWSYNNNQNVYKECILQGTNVGMALVPASHLTVIGTYCQSWFSLQDLSNGWTVATTFQYVLPDTEPPQASKQWWVKQRIKKPKEAARQPRTVGQIEHP
jgi:hypothetical protein